MRYFYVVFHGISGRVGNNVIRQLDPTGGLDLASAHLHILRTLGEPAIVTNWQEISQNQYARFVEYINECKRLTAVPAKPLATVLTLKKEKKPDGDDPNGNPS